MEAKDQVEVVVADYTTVIEAKEHAKAIITKLTTNLDEVPHIIHDKEVENILGDCYLNRITDNIKKLVARGKFHLRFGNPS